MSHTNPGARTARQRRVDVDVTTVLAVVLPILTVVAVLLVRPGDAGSSTHAPSRTALTSASVVCPTALPNAPTVHLATADKGVHGDVEVAAGEDKQKVNVSSGSVSTVSPGEGPVVVTGQGDLAPGLVGARFGAQSLAAVNCPATSPDQWFSAVGAGAGHDSTLELVNPDAGPAVADVTVYGASGVIDVPHLRGVRVPGHESVRLDLGQVVPRRAELALHVLTSRGRLAASVLDSADELGSGASSSDWLPAQAEPTTSNVLLGAAAGQGTRELALANPGEDEARVTVKVISPKSVFAPEGLDEIRLAPGTAKRVDLSEQLASAIDQGAFGLQVDSTVPVTATLRSVVDGDLSHATSGTPVTTGSTVVLPEGDKQVLLAQADGVGVVRVMARSADGKKVATTSAEVRPGAGAVVKLPPNATLVSVVPSRVSVVGAVQVTGAGGAAVVPLVELVRNGLIPDVRPGLP
jgi:Family of unknown function (DUF5719)